MQSQSFSLGQILSITHGRMLVQDFGDVYEILNFMTGDDLMTHALIRAGVECRPYLMESFSAWIEQAHADVDAFFAQWNHNTSALWAWMETMEAKYGATHEVLPVHPEDHPVIDPVEELLQMKPDAKIVPIDISDDTPSPYGDINWKN